MRQLIMIEVERMNGIKVFVNPDLIKLIEVTPDTVITFTDGEKILLRTKPQDIIDRIVAFKKNYSLPPVK